MKYIIQKLQTIIKNEDKLFEQAYNEQQKGIDLSNLLNHFFNEIANSNKLNKSERIELFRTFFNHLFCGKYTLQKILEIKDIESINKLTNLLKIDDIESANTSEGLKLDCDEVWKKVSDHYAKGMIYSGKKLECYYKNNSMQASEISNNVISPIVTIIKENTNDINKELTSKLLEYFDRILSILQNESDKYRDLCKRNESLVPADFWKNKAPKQQND